MQPDDMHIWFSVSKVVGPTMLAFLEEEGKIDVQKAVSFYLPELKNTEWDNVSVIETLDMATGLNGTEHDEPNHDSRTNPEQIWFQWAATSDVGILPDLLEQNQRWYNVLSKLERVKPGYTAFEYNSINTFIITKIVEKVADKPLNELFSEHIWSKIGMEHDGQLVASPSGNALGFMGVNSTLRDLARFGMAFTPSCTKIAPERVIPQSIMDKIQDISHADMYREGFAGKKFAASFPEEKVLANPYQWDVVFEDGDIFKSGVGG